MFVDQLLDRCVVDDDVILDVKDKVPHVQVHDCLLTFAYRHRFGHTNSDSLQQPAKMPPKAEEATDASPTAVLPLQDWLKLLSSRGVEMRVAMALAAKM